MTILDGDGIYGANNTSPSKHPKGILGRTDGTPSANDIGYTITEAVSGTPSLTNASSTLTFANVVGINSIALTPGVWLISYKAVGTISISGAQSTAAYGHIRIFDGTSPVGKSASNILISLVANAGGGTSQYIGSVLAYSEVIVITGNKTINLQSATNTGGAGSASFTLNADSFMSATRIA